MTHRTDLLDEIVERLVAGGLVEHVIADRRLSEQIGLPQRRLLPMPVEKIEELRLQRRARTIGVEVGEKGIVGLLEHDRRVEARAESFGERSLAGTDWSFNRDVSELQGAPMISSR